MDSFVLIVLYFITVFGSGKCKSFLERPEKGILPQSERLYITLGMLGGSAESLQSQMSCTHTGCRSVEVQCLLHTCKHEKT